MEPTAASSLAVAKVLGSQTVIAALAATMGFLILIPKTVGEALARIIFTMIASIVLGPLAVAATHAKWPELFESALHIARLQGTDIGVLYVTAPIQILAGLPAWWILGAFIRWFRKREGQDIGEMLEDAKGTLDKVLQRKSRSGDE